MPRSLTPCLRSLFAWHINDSLADDLYDACVAGSSWYYGCHDLGGIISLSGYSDTMVVLLREILQAVRTLKVDPARLRCIQEEVSISSLRSIFSGADRHGTSRFCKATSRFTFRTLSTCREGTLITGGFNTTCPSRVRNGEPWSNVSRCNVSFALPELTEV